jgi:DNA repair exonuclease SbcCD ATPase subunit
MKKDDHRIGKGMRKSLSAKVPVLIPLALFSLLLIGGSAQAKEVPYTLEDRERLIRVETKLVEMEKRFESRFEEVDKRLESLEKRFEARFAEIDKRFESIEKRFESLERQIDRQSFIFVTLIVAILAFAFWDRRTIIRKAKEETLEEIEKRIDSELQKVIEIGVERDQKVEKVIQVFRELARKDEEVARVLREWNLL